MRKLSLLALGAVVAALCAVPASADVGKHLTWTTKQGVTVEAYLAPPQIVAVPIGVGQVPSPQTIYCGNHFVMSQGWSQKAHSALQGVVWTNYQQGTYYFGCGGSGHQPWVWQSSQFGWDTAGYHACDTGGHGYGVTITGQGCWKSGDPSQSYLYDYDKFKVSLIAQGLPFSATYTLCAQFDPFDNMFNCS